MGQVFYKLMNWKLHPVNFCLDLAMISLTKEQSTDQEGVSW